MFAKRTVDETVLKRKNGLRWTEASGNEPVRVSILVEDRGRERIFDYLHRLESMQELARMKAQVQLEVFGEQEEMIADYMNKLAMASRFSVGDWCAALTNPGEGWWSIAHPSRVLDIPNNHKLTRTEALFWLRKLSKED